MSIRPQDALLITDLADPVFHQQKVLHRLKKGFFVASLITKNPAGLEPILRELSDEEARRVFVQVTITCLGGTRWEPYVPPAKEAFRGLAVPIGRLGVDHVTLRYDPIIPGVNDQEELFKRYIDCAVRLGIKGITISILDVYPHTRQRIQQARLKCKLPEGMHWPIEERQEILQRWLSAAGGRIVTRVCCEPGLEGYQRGGCDWVIEACETVTGRPFSPDDLPQGTQRKSCGCPKFEQILSYYDRCGHGCVYCYRKN
jgi:Domain of unknown function (DUF1848).